MDDVVNEFKGRLSIFKTDHKLIDGLNQSDQEKLYTWFICALYVHKFQITLEDAHVPKYDEKTVFPGEVVLSFSDETYYGYLQVLLRQPPTTLTYFLGKCIQYGISNTKTKGVNYRGILEDLYDVFKWYSMVSKDKLKELILLNIPEIIQRHTHDVIDYGLDDLDGNVIEHMLTFYNELDDLQMLLQIKRMDPNGNIKGTAVGGKTRKRKVKKSRKTRRSSYPGTKKKFTFKHKISKK